MRSEQENRDLRVEKIMWESEKRRLENSLEEARSESRLLDSESRSYWQSSPRATALDASLEVIDELNHQIDSLSTENTTLNTLYDRAEKEKSKLREENKSLRREKLRLDMEKQDLCSSAGTRYLGSIPRSSSAASKLYISSEEELCSTCKCRHSSPQRLCSTCKCVHKSSLSDVCPVCYCKYSQCPRSPGNVSYSEYSPILTDLSRTF